MSITKNQISFVKELHKKKERQAQSLFIVEGEKCVHELLNSTFGIETIFATAEWIDANSVILKQKKLPYHEISPAALERISTMSQPNKVLAIAKQPHSAFEINALVNKFALVIDGINDPGNLGTIIRVADWYGIENIICSPTTCEQYNPKVVQAAMGSLFRVNCTYIDIVSFLADYKQKVNQPVYAAHMQGVSINDVTILPLGILVLGSESHGISTEVMSMCDSKLTIVQKSIHQQTESLNAAVAAAIIINKILG